MVGVFRWPTAIGVASVSPDTSGCAQNERERDRQAQQSSRAIATHPGRLPRARICCFTGKSARGGPTQSQHPGLTLKIGGGAEAVKDAPQELNTYTQDYIDECRSRMESQLAAYKALVTTGRAKTGTSNAAFNSVVASFEPLFFTTRSWSWMDFSFIASAPWRGRMAIL